MAMTEEEIIKEALQLPPSARSEIADRLYSSVEPNPEVEAAWVQESMRRLEEVRSGKVKAIPGELVFAEARRLLGR